MTILRSVRVVLPSERTIKIDCDYSEGWPGNYENPPEPSEVTDVLSATDIETGEELTDAEIQNLFDDDASYEAMLQAADRHVPDEEEYDDYDDSMDGDHSSALTSVGWGCDEDYGYDGGNEDF